MGRTPQQPASGAPGTGRPSGASATSVSSSEAGREPRKRFVIGTAGHVDHGKTTLVQALTGVDTDRLPEEKRRGITIELGFAPLLLDDGIEASIVDVPGHRRLVHTMIAGATGIELVLVVVAADEGVMPQTREHLAACELLGIRRAVVAITMLDRAGAELAALAEAEVAALVAGRFEAEVVHCSARTGEGVDAVRAALRRALAALPAPDAGAPAHLAIDRIFSVKGAGTVITGTLTRGSLEIGQAIRVLGGASALESSARGLHIHDHAVARAVAPTRLAINLGRGAVDEAERGFLVTTDPEIGRSRVIDVGLRALVAIKPGATVEVYVGTARTTARLRWLAAPSAPAESPSGETASHDAAAAGDPGAVEAAPSAIARLALAHPIAVTGGDRVVLRTSSSRGAAAGGSGAVVAGGRVLDARPPAARRRALRVEALRAVERGDEATAIRALAAEAAPRSIQVAGLGGRFPSRSNDLARAAEKLSDKGDLVRIKPNGWTPRANVAAVAVRAVRLVDEHHKARPLERGIALETLRQKLGAASDAGVAEEAIRLACRKNATEPLVMAGDVVHSSRFGSEAPKQVSSVLDAARVALADAALKGLTEHQLGVATGLAARELRTLATRLVREGHAVAAGDLWFDARAIAALRDRLVEELGAASVLTIARFKDLSGLGRKQAIPLLELFDREGTTKRVGDDRVGGPLTAARLAQ